jgi:hypothetical protein
MQRQLRDPVLFLALWLLVLAASYWAGTRYGFADGGKGVNCANCPCKDVYSWQTSTDKATAGHGYQQQTDPGPPPTYSGPVLTGQTNISTIAPSSCTNNTGNTQQSTDSNYYSWAYANCAYVCNNPAFPCEVSCSDTGTVASTTGGAVNICTP